MSRDMERYGGNGQLSPQQQIDLLLGPGGGTDIMGKKPGARNGLALGVGLGLTLLTGKSPNLGWEAA